MFVLFHFEPINGQLQLYPSLPGVEGAQGISAGGPKGPTRSAQKKQSVWSRISLDNSPDLLNIIPAFSQARPENFCINISQSKTINILIPICLAIWGPFISILEGRLAAPRKNSLYGFESASMLQPVPSGKFSH
jgi:hypothetical protein